MTVDEWEASRWPSCFQMSKLLVVIRGMKQVLLPTDMKKKKLLCSNIFLILLTGLRYGVMQVNRSYGRSNGKITVKRVWYVREGWLLRTYRYMYFATFPKVTYLEISGYFQIINQVLRQMDLYLQPIRELFVRNKEVHHCNTRQQCNPRIPVHKWNTAVSKKKFYSYGNPSLGRSI